MHITDEGLCNETRCINKGYWFSMVSIVWNTGKAPSSGNSLNLQPLNEEVGLKFF